MNRCRKEREMIREERERERGRKREGPKNKNEEREERERENHQRKNAFLVLKFKKRENIAIPDNADPSISATREGWQFSWPIP